MHPHNRRTYPLAVLLTTCAACFCIASLHTLRSACCGSQTAGSNDNKFLRETEPAATKSQADNSCAYRERVLTAQGRTLPRLASIKVARAEARAALDKELQVQAKIRAALNRQTRRHKTLLKQLEEEGWHLSATTKIARGSLRQDRESLAKFLQSEEYVQLRQERRMTMHGRGIAIAAGGPVPLANVYVTLHILQRVHKCLLPIEIFHNGPHELDAVTKQVFEEEFHSLHCINIADFKQRRHQLYASSAHVLSKQQLGWVLKAQMLSATSFEEVLILDADNLPLKDPTYLFDSPDYRKSQNLFWPDFWSSNWHNPGPVYDMLNLTEPWEARPDLLTTESGQLLLNRRVFDKVLEWVMFLNLHADLVYAVLWGDKDTYRLAFELAGQGHIFNQVNHQPANALRVPHLQSDRSKKMKGGHDEPPAVYSHAGMLQLAPTGEMLFLHRTAGSKLDPRLDYAQEFCLIDYITPPLSPQQAAHLHIAGPMETSKFDLTRAGSCVTTDLDLARAASKCNMTSGAMGDVQRAFPIPLLAAEDFPGLSTVLNESMSAFRWLQHQFELRALPLSTPT